MNIKNYSKLLIGCCIALHIGCGHQSSGVDVDEYTLLGQVVAGRSIELLPRGGKLFILQPTKISTHPDRPDLKWLDSFKQTIKQSSGIQILDILKIPLPELYTDVQDQTLGWQVSNLQKTVSSSPADLFVSFTGPPAEIPTGHWLENVPILSVSPKQLPSVSRLKALHSTGMLRGVYIPTRDLLLNLDVPFLRKGMLGDYYRYIPPSDIGTLENGVFNRAL